MNNEHEKMPTALLETRAPFDSIFPIQDIVLKKVIKSMNNMGYDPAHPIIVWMCDKPIVLDGHTRLRAALHVGIKDVSVIIKQFEDAGEALDYAVSQQVERRNLTPGDMIRYIEAADKLAERGRKKLAPIGANSSGKSSAKLADILHVSQRQAERLRKIAKDGSEDTKQALADGKISIHNAYEQTRNEDDGHAFDGVENPEVSQDERIRHTKKLRFAAIPEMLEHVIEEKIARERRMYPDIHYTEKEIANMVTKITEIVNKQLSKLA